MIDFSASSTVPPARYDLQKVTPDTEFLELLLRDKHVVLDWGFHHMWVCREPFTVDYDKKLMLTQSGAPVEDSQWIGCDPDELHQQLRHAFVGEWGPTTADFIVRMERSGVRVELCGTKNYGPKDPQGYMAWLRASL
jgi:hypothetical protein